MTQMQGAQTKQCNVKSDLLSQETKSMKITQKQQNSTALNRSKTNARETDTLIGDI